MKKKSHKLLSLLLSVTMLLNWGVASVFAEGPDVPNTKILSATDIAVDANNFQDSVFLSWILANIPAAADGILTQEELSSVTVMDLYGKDVIDLKGIEYFTNLKELKCGGNWTLKSMDVSKNINLITLQCSVSQLKSIDVSNNSKLQVLSCRDAGLETLDISNNKELTELNCAENNLSNLNLENQSHLTTLRAYNNKLESIDVSNNTALTYLRVDTNNLSNLDVSNNKELTYLDCETNQLTELDVATHTKLTRVNFANNRLISVNLPADSTIESGTEAWYNKQTPTKIAMNQNKKFDLRSLAPSIQSSKINNVQRADITETILTNLTQNAIVTFDYDCGANKTIRVTLTVDLANYTMVDEAIKAANALNKDNYKDFSAVTSAINAVVRNKDITKQGEVDEYATAIEDAIQALVYKDADYTKVKEALAKIPADLTKYTDETVQALHAARNAVVDGKNMTEQETVNGYATAIEDAIKALVLKSGTTVIVDSDTGTRIEREDGSAFDSTVILSVAPKPQSEMDKFKNAIDKAAPGLVLGGLYDIKLLKDGVVIQPNGKIKVSIPLTKNMKSMTDLKVVYIDDNGKVTIIPSEVKDGMIVFVTDHFSYYGVIGKVKAAGSENNSGNGTNSPHTGDDMPIVLYMLLSFGSLGAIAMLIKKRKMKATKK